MSRYKVLVDSSVWIQYFKKGKLPILDRLIEENLVCVNELILTELIPILKKQQHYVAIDSLNSLELIPLKIDWELIREYQFMNLKNGINKVGIPDLMILQQAIEEKMTLYTLDKHFKLMNEIYNFELVGKS
ncbi:MAG: PIN domain-containing protein [Balneola sp.]